MPISVLFLRRDTFYFSYSTLSYIGYLHTFKLQKIVTFKQCALIISIHPSFIPLKRF